MRKFSFPGAACAALAMVMVMPTQATEVVRIGGTGAGLAYMQQVGDRIAVAQPEIRAEVLPSLGTPGGIKALAAREIEIAIAARDLKPEETAQGIREAACMTTALIFATSHPNPSGVTRAQLPELFANPSPAWPDGRPLKVILRSRAGSENPYLIAAVPGMESALAAAYKRPGMPIGSTDQENVEIAERTAGSFAITTLLQILAERLRLRAVPLDGIAPSAQTLSDRTYPLPLRLCLLLSASPSAGATRIIDFVRSAEGQALTRAVGAEPAN